MGPNPKKPRRKTSNFITVVGTGDGPAMKYDFDPRYGEELLKRDAIKSQAIKDHYRGEISHNRFKNKGGKISKYYKAGGNIITGR